MFTFILTLALLPFALYGLALLLVGAWYLRYAIVAVVGVAVVGLVYLYNQSTNSAASAKANAPALYAKCAENVDANADRFYQEASSNGHATEAYVAELSAAQTSAKAKCAQRYN